MAQVTQIVTGVRDVERLKKPLEERSVRAAEQAADALESISQQLSELVKLLEPISRNFPKPR